tara:strand:+ start:9901 stop:10128 length:228 start_codon:yes stop_codon:yes gene_type:complete
MEKNGDNMSIKNGDAIVVRWIDKNAKEKIWTSVFIDFDSYLDFINSENKIIVTQDRKNSVFGAWAERIGNENEKR